MVNKIYSQPAPPMRVQNTRPVTGTSSGQSAYFDNSAFQQPVTAPTVINPAQRPATGNFKADLQEVAEQYRGLPGMQPHVSEDERTAALNELDRLDAEHKHRRTGSAGEAA